MPDATLTITGPEARPGDYFPLAGLTIARVETDWHYTDGASSMWSESNNRTISIRRPAAAQDVYVAPSPEGSPMPTATTFAPGDRLRITAEGSHGFLRDALVTVTPVSGGGPSYLVTTRNDALDITDDASWEHGVTAWVNPDQVVVVSDTETVAPVDTHRRTKWQAVAKMLGKDWTFLPDANRITGPDGAVLVLSVSGAFDVVEGEPVGERRPEVFYASVPDWIDDAGAVAAALRPMLTKYRAYVKSVADRAAARQRAEDLAAELAERIGGTSDRLRVTFSNRFNFYATVDHETYSTTRIFFEGAAGVEQMRQIAAFLATLPTEESLATVPAGE